MAEFINRIFSRVTGWDSQDPYEDEEYAAEETYEASPEISVPTEAAREKSGFFRRPGKVVEFRPPTGAQVVIMQPGAIDSAQEACNHLRAGRTVICNFEKIDQKVAQRVIDFITGATYAIDGQVHKVSPVIFLAVPRSIALVDDNAADGGEYLRSQGIPAAY
jgi:cell division inhibitor SepF